MTGSITVTPALRSADFPGDTGYMRGVQEDYAPCLIVNTQASKTELASGAIHRLTNANDLVSLLMDRAHDLRDLSLLGCMTTLGRLCNEAREICSVLIEQIEKSEGTPKKGS